MNLPILAAVFAAAVILPLASRAQPQAAAVAAAVTVSANPEHPCLDPRRAPYLNFDLAVRNGTPAELKLRELRAVVLNPEGEMIERRLLWQEAVSILGIHATIAPGAEGVIYNPFTLTSVKPGVRVRYELQFEGRAAPAVLTVRPRACVTRARLILPLSGRVLVHDGYDFLSHHRRQDYQARPDLKAFGIVDNWFRFAIDLIPVDARGALFRGEGAAYGDWYGWGMPVRAAGDGVVAAVRDTIPDNSLGSEQREAKRLSQDEMDADGNYVLIDHGTGEVSAYSHLRQGSARVKKGDRVKAGQIVAAIGNSGATPVPHLHYELRAAPGLGVRGVRTLPAYFHDLQVLGTGEDAGSMAVNTGDVLLAR